MFQLLGMFSDALGMFGSGASGTALSETYDITTESVNPLITEAGENIITE